MAAPGAVVAGEVDSGNCCFPSPCVRRAFERPTKDAATDAVRYGSKSPWLTSGRRLKRRGVRGAGWPSIIVARKSVHDRWVDDRPSPN